MASDEIHLHHVFTLTDLDREFWARHLESFVPERVIDAHVHIADPSHEIETLTDEQKRSYWVLEVAKMQTAETAQRCIELLYPGREVSCIGFGNPTLGWDIEAGNRYVSVEVSRRGWKGLALVRPTWAAGQIEWLLDQPGIIGVKPYYSLIGYDRTGRDRYIETSIFDFLPHHQLEVLDERGAWLTLHVPHGARLPHPDNIREVREIRRRYRRIRLVIAHLGRCYTLPQAQAALPQLADDPDLYFDNSAVMNPDVHHLALKIIGPKRILYGTDNPVFYMRGRQTWTDQSYAFHTSHAFSFNTLREPPEVEAGYTLTMYEALHAIRQAFERLGMGRTEAELIFHDNARRLIAAKPARPDNLKGVVS